jgi:hypothetical protein
MVGMISKHSAEVFGYVPKDLKRRMASIRKQDAMWSESRMIKEALIRFIPLLEMEQSHPIHERSRRRLDAAV